MMLETLPGSVTAAVERPLVVVARSEAADALADVRHRLDVLRHSSETAFVQVGKRARPVVVVVAAASIALFCLWKLSRRKRALYWQPPPRPSILSSALRSVALSVARVALARLTERVVGRALAQDLAERPSGIAGA
jgi:hypothetical protein